LQYKAIDFGLAHAAESGIANAKVSAIPRPVSPFNWTVVIDDGHLYRYAHVNLVRRTVSPAPHLKSNLFAKLDAPYRPLEEAVWSQAPRFGTGRDETAFAREAYDQPDFRFFRWFAAYPALLRVDSGGGERCAWFRDLRFETPGRGATPCEYGMCRRNQRWQAFQLIGG